MCACDESVGRKFLAQELEFGVELDTKRQVLVTAGFQQKVCEECRGLRLTPHPKSASTGRTSKIARYYWRELAFETMKRFDVWSQTQGLATEPLPSTQKLKIGFGATYLRNSNRCRPDIRNAVSALCP